MKPRDSLFYSRGMSSASSLFSSVGVLIFEKVEEDWRDEREESGGDCSTGRKVFGIG